MTHRRRRITCLVRGGRSCPLEQHPHRIRPEQPASQETRIRPPRQDTIRMAGQRDQVINPSMSHQKPSRVSLTEHDQVWINRPTQRDALTRTGRTRMTLNHGIFHGNLDGKVSNLHETLLQQIGRSSSARSSCELYEHLLSLFLRTPYISRESASSTTSPATFAALPPTTRPPPGT